MHFATIARRTLSTVDRGIARATLPFERPGLVSLLFHSVFESRAEIARDLVHPQEGLTIDALRRCIEHLLAAGYRFVSVADVETGLDAEGRHACLTFDDGYANNLRLVPVLREYGVPACVFVATNHVAEAKRFWWDVVYVERRRRGATPEAIEREIASSKSRSLGSIEQHVADEFGSGWSRPQSDLDRPMTPHELQRLASEPLVTIGNHTADHPRLTSLHSDEVEAQLVDAQGYLETLLGVPPRAVAYPNGDVNDVVVGVASRTGLAIGLTTEPRKERVPLTSERVLRIGRFQLGHGDVDDELRVVRSDLQLANTARRARGRLKSR